MPALLQPPDEIGPRMLVAGRDVHRSVPPGRGACELSAEAQAVAGASCEPPSAARQRCKVCLPTLLQSFDELNRDCSSMAGPLTVRCRRGEGLRARQRPATALRLQTSGMPPMLLSAFLGLTRIPNIAVC